MRSPRVEVFPENLPAAAAALASSGRKSGLGATRPRNLEVRKLRREDGTVRVLGAAASLGWLSCADLDDSGGVEAAVGRAEILPPRCATRGVLRSWLSPSRSSFLKSAGIHRHLLAGKTL